MRRSRLPKIVRTREKFLETERLIISLWSNNDEFYAYALFGHPTIASYYANKTFLQWQINDIVKQEKRQFEKHKFCLFPIFDKEKLAFVGVCGLRIFKEECQFVIIFMPHQWHKGYGQEVAQEIIRYAFEDLHAPSLIAARCVDDKFSEYIYEKMGFKQIQNCFRSPNGKQFCAYLLYARDFKKKK